MKNRYDNMPALIDLMDAQFAARPRDEWGRMFDEAGLIWGPASTLAELADDPQAEAAGLFPTIDHPTGRFRTVAVPVHIDGADVGPRGPAPDIGQHTEDVLEAAGLTPGEVAALAAAGVVGPSNLDEPDDQTSIDLRAQQAQPSADGHRSRPAPRTAGSSGATTTKRRPKRTPP